VPAADSSLQPWADAARAALPWIVAPILVWWRARDSHSLDDTPAAPPADPPLVSVVVPARDEARNIERCLRSVLATTYPRLEVIVVDDHSADGTGALARAIDDPRLRVLDNPPLPDGWFGKQWACRTGARAARGDVLVFADADTTHAPDLVGRLVNELRARGGGLLSVVGRQELGTFWERVVQPHVFWMLATRYGGTETVNRSRRAEDKIANGQCIFVRREAYDAIGGHGAVRHQVAEDVAIAQRLFAAGQRTEVVMSREDLTTRMYTSLGEIMAGWRKNVFAGGREAMPGGRAGQLLFPLLLLLVPLLTVLPPLALGGALLAAAPPAWLLLGATIALAAELATWGAVYRWMRAPVAYALIFPLGALVFAVIAIQAIARGSRVEWKGRAYRTTPRARTSR